RRNHLEPRREMERATFSRRAAHADGPVHQLHQLLADGETEATAAITPRDRFVGLRKGVEQLRLLLGREADTGVGHLEQQLDVFTTDARSGQRRGQSYSQPHAAAARELEG